MRLVVQEADVYRSRTFISTLATLLLLVSLIAIPEPVAERVSITIYLGRRGCEPGFGICKIDIETGSRT
jgi:hypothetical protein